MGDKVNAVAEASGNWSSATWGGALITAIGALSLAQWLAIGGFIIACAGFVVNAVHKRRMRILREREIQIKEQQLALARRSAGEQTFYEMKPGE